MGTRLGSSYGKKSWLRRRYFFDSWLRILHGGYRPIWHIYLDPPRLTTFERAKVNFPVVVKKDGRRIDYDPAKLRGSFALALRKRPVSTEQVGSAIDRIEEKLLNLGLHEVRSARIGELVMRELKKIDKVGLCTICQRLPQF